MTLNEIQNYDNPNLESINEEELSMNFTYDLGSSEDAEQFCASVADIAEELKVECFTITYPDESEEGNWYIVDVCVSGEEVSEETLNTFLEKIDEIA